MSLQNGADKEGRCQGKYYPAALSGENVVPARKGGGKGGGTASPNSGSDKPGNGGNELEFEPTEDACW